jgi:uncharacterized protein YhaN
VFHGIVLCEQEEFDRLASVHDEAQRAAEHDAKERKEANQVDRAKKALEEKAKALSNQNRVGRYI